MGKTMKRWIAAILSLILFFGGIGYLADEKMDTVEAAETAEKEEIAEYGTYVWESLAYESSDKAPVCKTEGYFFAGYYEDDKTTPVATPKVGNKYQAKFVPDDVLSVKCQTAQTVDKTAPADVRFITTVDSLNYQTVGFRVKTDKKDGEIPLNGVLRKITADNGAGAYGYSPSIFDPASKYYATVTCTGISDHNKPYFVEPYWITLDGTRVAGISRYMHVSDSYALPQSGNGGEGGFINVPVYLNSADGVEIGAGTTITIAKKRYRNGSIVVDDMKQHIVWDYEAGYIFTQDQINVVDNDTEIVITIDDGVQAQQAKGLLVNLRFYLNYSYNNKDGAVSKYLFEMTASNADIKVSDIIQRNLLLNSMADIAPYILDGSVVVITNIAEFKGIQTYLSGNGTLGGKTILLATDLDLNPNWTANSSDAATTTYATPTTFDFKGTFDGQGHTIKGLCVASDSAEGGLFKKIDAAGTVKNLVMDNCRVARESSKKAGVIAGVIAGTIENVEIKNSVISNSGAKIGALCGEAHGLVKNTTVTNCTVTAGGDYAGGITGSIENSGTLKDVLIQNSTVTNNSGYVSGITSSSNHTTTSIDGAVVKKCNISGVWAAGVMCSPKSTIANVQVIDGTTIAGQFGGAGGVVHATSYAVKNAKVQDVTVTSSGRTGGIAVDLQNGGSISKAYCDATITNTSTIDATGGIVAKVTGTGNETITDCWYAGVLNGKIDLGGIVGRMEDASATISHCHSTGTINLTATAGRLNVGGIIGLLIINSADDTGTATIEDCLNFAKLNALTDYQPYYGGIVGQIYIGGTSYAVNINSTYFVNNFGAASAEEAAGWPRAFNANKTVKFDGVDKTGQIDDCKENEYALLQGKTEYSSQAGGILRLSVDSSQGTVNENCWWIIDSNGPRLKSFRDMEFKRYQPAQ